MQLASMRLRSLMPKIPETTTMANTMRTRGATAILDCMAGHYGLRDGGGPWPCLVPHSGQCSTRELLHSEAKGVPFVLALEAIRPKCCVMSNLLPLRDSGTDEGTAADVPLSRGEFACPVSFRTGTGLAWAETALSRSCQYPALEVRLHM